MTSNEVAYWQVQEQKRSNLMNESLKDFANKETRRSNMANENIKKDTLSESQRHNQTTERIDEKQVDAQSQRWQDQSFFDGINAATNVAGAVSKLFKGGK